jgi:serine/threonine protein kinase
MIDSKGRAHLIDFSNAKAIPPITPGGFKALHAMIFTEGYSAPEQYKGQLLPQSDIYSLGATLHHVITRKDPRLEPPFSFEERRIGDFNEKAPPGLAEVIEKALQFDPNMRWRSALEMKTALESVRRNLQQ